MSALTLAQFIGLVESDGDGLAVRFEPAHHPKDHHVLTMMELARCNRATGAVLCAMSWGEFQIMGDNLVALGLEVSPFEYLMSPAMQEEFFRRYIAADHLTLTLEDILTDRKKRELFARLYNGPGNIDGYVARMTHIANQNGLKVIG